MTISDLEEVIARKLGELPLIPPGFRVLVELQSNKRRKKRSASAENWHPTRGDVGVFRLEPIDPKQQSMGQPNSKADESPASRSNNTPPIATSVATQELIRSLAAAESRPGYQFIALKWFRDSYLSSQSFTWAVNADARRKIIADAIENGLLVTAKIPNPHQPFPTTTIRVNRNNPMARSILGLEAHAGWDFTPVEVRGEPISETMLRERG